MVLFAKVVVPFRAVVLLSVAAPVTAKVPPNVLAPVPTVKVFVPSTLTFPLKVFAPPKICASFVTTPRTVSLASGIFSVMLLPNEAGEPDTLISFPVEPVPNVKPIVPNEAAEVQFKTPVFEL